MYLRNMHPFHGKMGERHRRPTIPLHEGLGVSNQRERPRPLQEATATLRYVRNDENRSMSLYHLKPIMTWLRVEVKSCLAEMKV